MSLEPRVASEARGMEGACGRNCGEDGVSTYPHNTLVVLGDWHGASAFDEIQFR